MPSLVTPDGRADLEAITEDLVDHMKLHCRGINNIIGSREIAEKYEVSLWQARTCAFQARVQLRLEDEMLCARRGPGGGFFIAMTEEEARFYSLSRSEQALTEVDNIVKDIETALRGVVRSAPSQDIYWRRTRRRLGNVTTELTSVRHELALAAGSSGTVEEDES